MDAFIFAFGGGVTFLCLGGMYVWFRRGFQASVRQSIPANHVDPEPTGE